MTTNNVLSWPIPATEPRHDTTDPAWYDALLWLRAHPEYASISASVLSAFLAGARGEREARHDQSR